EKLPEVILDKEDDIVIIPIFNIGKNLSEVSKSLSERATELDFEIMLKDKLKSLGLLLYVKDVNKYDLNSLKMDYVGNVSVFGLSLKDTNNLIVFAECDSYKELENVYQQVNRDISLFPEVGTDFEHLLVYDNVIWVVQIKGLDVASNNDSTFSKIWNGDVLTKAHTEGKIFQGYKQVEHTAIQNSVDVK
ncbi:hypothetical protein MHBO_003813, partial [Bonamia ostreae]